MSEENSNTPQVYIYACLAHLPFFFALHTWFVVREGGVRTRYEVLWRSRKAGEGSGHLYTNAFAPSEGIELVPFWDRFHSKGRQLACVEGEPALRLAGILARSSSEYPHRDYYALLGPNSNTYVQWVLDQAPTCDVRLPWNAFGARWHAGRTV